MVPKQGPKAIQAENDEITKLEGRLMKFLDFSGPRPPFHAQNGVKNGVQNGILTLKASESLLEASWRPLGALRPKKTS